MKPLEKKVAVVAGATRGAGRGIACMLGEAGATVYCTGRSTRAHKLELSKGDTGAPFELARRPETVEETAEMVDRYGGKGIAMQADHTIPEQVKTIFERITAEQGRLDILVNDIWGGDELSEWGPKFWEMNLENGLLMQERAVTTHIITAHYAAPLMVARKEGLIVEITDGDQEGYRGSFYYDLAKMTVIRLAFNMSHDLRSSNVAAVAVTPGFLRSEAMLEHFGVTEANWQEGAKKDPNFIASETPYFVGRAVAALAADPNIMEKSGKVFASWTLSDEYGFTDIDERRPHWGRHFDKHVKDK